MFVFATKSFRVIASRAMWSCCALLALHGTCRAAQGDSIYRVDDDGESVLLTDQSYRSGAHIVVEAPIAHAPQRSANPSAGVPHDSRLTEIVRNAAHTHRIAPELLHAVIAAESGYAVRAVSPRGAQGLMQLMPATARSYGVTDPFDPQQNVNAGARHLRGLLDQFGQDTRLALAAYNAGATSVVRHRHRIPPFPETAAYVPRVLRHFAQLQVASVAPSTLHP